MSRKRAKSGRKNKTERKNNLEKPPSQPWGSYAEEIVPLPLRKCIKISSINKQKNSVEAADPDRKIQCTKHSSTSARNPENISQSRFAMSL